MVDRTCCEKVISPFSEQVALLDTIPGVNRRTAETLIAEIGADMGRFPTHRHLASWAGMCPGNNESAGKHRSGRTRKGSKWLRHALVESAAAARTRGSYFSAQYAASTLATFSPENRNGSELGIRTRRNVAASPAAYELISSM